MKQTAIYHLVNPRTGSVRYVGKTINPRRRENAHKRKYPTLYFQIQFWVPADGDWIQAEQDEIKKHNPPLNQTDGGEGLCGRKHTDRARQKMRENSIGDKNPFYGKKHTEESKRKIKEANSGKNHYLYGKHRSEETKKKLREANLGRKCAPRSPETCRRISEGQKGRKSWAKGKKFSEEHKRKISEAHKGKVFSEETRKKMSVSAKKRRGRKTTAVDRSKDGIRWERFESIKETGVISTSHIGQCCRGQRKTAGGYKWRYAV